jgi:hypothetical protein
MSKMRKVRYNISFQSSFVIVGIFEKNQRYCDSSGSCGGMCETLGRGGNSVP